MKTTKKRRPLFQPLMAIVLSVNLIVVVQTIDSNQNTKRVNEEISELNTRQERLLEQQAEELEQRKEINKKITEILNRHQY